MGGYKLQGMGLGTCAACHQRAEVHQHPVTGDFVCENHLKWNRCQNCNQYGDLKQDPNDQRMVCPACITPMGLEQHRPTGILPTEFQRVAVNTERRQKLLDFIATNATEAWITGFTQQRLAALRLRMLDHGQWIQEIEQEPNERVLLRMATQLGYREGPVALIGPEPRPEIIPAAKKGTKNGKRGKRARRSADPHIPGPDDS